MRQLPVTWAGPDGGLLEAAPTRPTKTHEWDSLGCHGLNCYFGNGTKNFQTFKKNLVASMREREVLAARGHAPDGCHSQSRAGLGWAGSGSPRGTWAFPCCFPGVLAGSGALTGGRGSISRHGFTHHAHCRSLLYKNCIITINFTFSF